MPADGLPTSPSRFFGKAGWLAGIVLLLLMLALALRGSAQVLLWRFQPETAMRIWPHSEAALVTMRRDPLKFRTVPGGADLTAALRSAPLSEEPFFVLANAAFREGDLGRYDRLTKIATDREWNERIDRARLIRLYLSRARWARTIAEARAMAGRDPVVAWAMTRMLVLMSVDERARAVLLRLLRDDPTWKSRLFRAASKQADLRDLVADLKADLEDPVLASAAGSGDLFDEHLRWVMQLPIDQLDDVAGVFDERFSHGAGSSPFAWNLANGEGSGASIVRNPAGGGNDLVTWVSVPDARLLALQFLVLSPGAYALEVRPARRASAQAGAAGSFRWTVECLSGQQLGSVQLNGAGTQEVVRSRPFTVTPTCELQRLRLTGANRQGRGRAQMAFSSVALVPSL